MVGYLVNLCFFFWFFYLFNLSAKLNVPPKKEEKNLMSHFHQILRFCCIFAVFFRVICANVECKLCKVNFDGKLGLEVYFRFWRFFLSIYCGKICNIFHKNEQKHWLYCQYFISIYDYWLLLWGNYFCIEIFFFMRFSFILKHRK